MYFERFSFFNVKLKEKMILVCEQAAPMNPGRQTHSVSLKFLRQAASFWHELFLLQDPEKGHLKWI